MMIDHAILQKPIPGVRAKLTERQCNQLHLHAMEAYPNEAVGFIDTRGKYQRLTNIAEDPTHHTQISVSDRMSVLESGKVFFHSHPNGPNCPSGVDILSANEMDLPHCLVATDGEACAAPVFYGDCLEKPPLLGRGFIHGFTDCFGLGRDFHKVVLGIELPDFPRDWAWWEDNNLPDDSYGLYLDHYKRMGFEEVEGELEIGDVFLLKIRSRVPNHAGFYVGSHCMIHHLSGRMENDPTRLSTIEPLVRWREHERLDKVLRYGGNGGCAARSSSTGV